MVMDSVTPTLPAPKARITRKRNRTKESQDPDFYANTDREHESIMSTERSPAAKLGRKIKDVRASAVIQTIDMDKLERSTQYQNAKQPAKDQMRIEALKKKAESMQATVNSLLEVNKSQAEIARTMEKRHEEERGGIMLNNRAVNRNNRDMAVIYRTLDCEAKRSNGKSVKISGLELQYAYDGSLGTNKWAEKGSKLIAELKIPETILHRETDPVQFEWGFRDEQIVYSANNHIASRRSMEQQKKTIIIATFSTTYVPDWLTSREGIERLKAVKANGQYSKYLSISKLLGPGGELMSRYVQDTRANMVFAKTNKAQDFPELADIDKIYTDGNNNQILKLLLKQKAGQKKDFIKINYDDIPHHPLTRHHIPSYNGDPKRKRPQPMNITGKCGVVRKRVHDVEEGSLVYYDEELMEDQLGLPKNATPHVFRPSIVPQNASEETKKMINTFNEEAKVRYQKDKDYKQPPGTQGTSNMEKNLPSTSSDIDTVMVDSRMVTRRTVVDGNLA